MSALLWLILLSVLKSLDTWPTVMWSSWNVLIEELVETFLPSVTFISTDFRSPPIISDLVRACSRSYFTAVTHGKATDNVNTACFEVRTHPCGRYLPSFCRFERQNIACHAGAGFILLVFIEHVREKRGRTLPLFSPCACTHSLEANWHCYTS